MTIERKDLLGTSRAIFSDCEKYRYALWREWDESLPCCAWVMLNPSTADEFTNDPTVAKCIEFSKRWGFGSIGVANLFALRSTDPEAMKLAAEPIGPENDYWIAHVCLNAERVIIAWGNDGIYLGQGAEALEGLKCIPGISRGEVWALKINGTGEPAHPLYQPYLQPPVKIYG